MYVSPAHWLGLNRHLQNTNSYLHTKRRYVCCAIRSVCSFIDLIFSSTCLCVLLFHAVCRRGSKVHTLPFRDRMSAYRDALGGLLVLDKVRFKMDNFSPYKLVAVQEGSRYAGMVSRSHTHTHRRMEQTHTHTHRRRKKTTHGHINSAMHLLRHVCVAEPALIRAVHDCRTNMQIVNFSQTYRKPFELPAGDVPVPTPEE
jgi:hypothetical protein